MTGPKLNEKSFVAGERSGTKATARYVRASASKARAVLDLIRGLDVRSADEVLQFTDRHIARDVRKVLASAVANAVNNDGQDAEELYVVACFADEGPTLKRFRPRARGRATRINKRSCHITVIVARMSDDRIAVIQARQERAGGRAGRGRPQSTAASRRARVERSRAKSAGTDTEATTTEDTTTEDTPTDEITDDTTSAVTESVEAPEAEVDESADVETTARTEDDTDSPDAGEGSASDEPDAARGGNEVDDEPALEQGSASDEAEPAEENQRADEKGKS
jgi:large subunit ribosomal protein L22